MKLTTRSREHFMFIIHSWWCYVSLLWAFITEKFTGDITMDKWQEALKKVENIKPGDNIVVVFNNDQSRQAMAGAYIGMGANIVVMEVKSMAINSTEPNKIISIPFSAIRYIEFKDIKVDHE
jgi:iron only hydrogenase large subunit-like protein